MICCILLQEKERGMPAQLQRHCGAGGLLLLSVIHGGACRIEGRVVQVKVW